MLLGWLMWLRAWLGGVRPRGRVEAVEPLGWIALPEGWAGDAPVDCRPAEVVAMAALQRRLGNPKLFWAQWRRLVCRWTSFARVARGDIRLPPSHERRPDCGPEPPDRRKSVSSMSRERVSREGWRVGAWQVSEWA